jgi:3-dehydroquinate dehydratase-2
MPIRIAIINGANLNLLGQREPNIYGSQTFEAYFAQLCEQYADRAQLVYYQSNIEGELLNFMHDIGFSYDGILLNAGAYTHTSIALGDCIRAITTPVLEIHISNIFAREPFRHHSHLSAPAVGIISGLGLEGYRLGIDYFLRASRFAT